MPKTKVELEQEIAELKEQLLQKAAEVNALSKVSKEEEKDLPPKTVTVINVGGTRVSIPYEWNGREKTLVLESTGSRRTGALPYEVWIDLERNSKLVSYGYIARLDVPTDNPNVIFDIDEFFSLPEAGILKRISLIENVNVLHRLWSKIQSNSTEKHTGKDFVVSKAVRDRVFALSGVQMLDSDPFTTE